MSRSAHVDGCCLVLLILWWGGSMAAHPQEHLVPGRGSLLRRVDVQRAQAQQCFRRPRLFVQFRIHTTRNILPFEYAAAVRQLHPQPPPSPLLAHAHSHPAPPAPPSPPSPRSPPLPSAPPTTHRQPLSHRVAFSHSTNLQAQTEAATRPRVRPRAAPHRRRATMPGFGRGIWWIRSRSPLSSCRPCPCC